MSKIILNTLQEHLTKTLVLQGATISNKQNKLKIYSKPVTKNKTKEQECLMKPYLSL